MPKTRDRTISRKGCSVRSGSRGSSRASVKARVSPMRSSNGRMGSGPASLDSWPGDGSITSGVPKKSKTWGQAAGKLICHLLGCGKDRARQRVRRGHNDSGTRSSGRGGCLAGAFALSVSPMSEVTRILSAIEQGDPHAAGQLLPLVYDELRQLAARQLAREMPGQTLQPTALVHEAYLRLVGDQKFEGRGHFFAAAAEAMRRVLIEAARRKQSPKHGG